MDTISDAERRSVGVARVGDMHYCIVVDVANADAANAVCSTTREESFSRINVCFQYSDLFIAIGCTMSCYAPYTYTLEQISVQVCLQLK